MTELLENYSHTYKYLVNEKAKKYTLLDGSRTLTNTQSIYDSLFSFLNYDLGIIQSALDTLYYYKENSLSFEKFKESFKIIEHELRNIFGDSIIVYSDIAFETDNIAVDFIIKDYTEFIKQCVFKMRNEIEKNACLESVINFCNDNKDSLKQRLPKNIYVKMEEFLASDPITIDLFYKFSIDFCSSISGSLLKNFNDKTNHINNPTLINSNEIQQLQEKYYRFFLYLCIIDSPLDSPYIEMINTLPLKELKKIFYAYYCHIENMFYEKIYPTFYLHTNLTHTSPASKPPYKLNYIQQKILRSLSHEIIDREYARLNSNAIQSEIEKIEIQNQINLATNHRRSESSYDHILSGKTNSSFLDYYSKNSLKKKTFDAHTIDSLRCNEYTFDYPIKIYKDLWFFEKNPQKFSIQNQNNKKNLYNGFSEQYSLDNIEYIFVVHYHIFIRGNCYAYRCASLKCHKLNYTNNPNKYCCNAKCTTAHKNELYKDNPQLCMYTKLERKTNSLLKNFRNTNLSEDLWRLKNDADDLLHLYIINIINAQIYDKLLEQLSCLYNNYNKLLKLKKKYSAYNIDVQEYEAQQQSFMDSINKKNDDIQFLHYHAALYLRMKDAEIKDQTELMDIADKLLVLIIKDKINFEKYETLFKQLLLQVDKYIGKDTTANIKEIKNISQKQSVNVPSYYENNILLPFYYYEIFCKNFNDKMNGITEADQNLLDFKELMNFADHFLVSILNDDMSPNDYSHLFEDLKTLFDSYLKLLKLWRDVHSAKIFKNNDGKEYTSFIIDCAEYNHQREEINESVNKIRNKLRPFVPDITKFVSIPKYLID